MMMMKMTRMRTRRIIPRKTMVTTALLTQSTDPPKSSSRKLTGKETDK